MNNDIIILDKKEKKYECLPRLGEKTIQNIINNVRKYNNKYGERYEVIYESCLEFEKSKSYKDWEHYQAVYDSLWIEYNNDPNKTDLLERWVKDI